MIEYIIFNVSILIFPILAIIIMIVLFRYIRLKQKQKSNFYQILLIFPIIWFCKLIALIPIIVILIL